MSSITNANSRAASDWAAKRKQAMDRAAALKAERQATLRERRNSGAVDGLEPLEGVGQLRSQPPAAAGVWHVANGSRHTASQPTSDLPGGHRVGNNLPLRPNSEAAGGEGQLPEWARDFSNQRQPRGHGGAGGYVDDNGGFDPYDGGAGYSELPSPPYDQMGYAYGGAGDPYGYDGHAGVPAPPPPALPSQTHFTQQQAAAAAARWPTNMPLGQSDGGIGYARQRAMPRGPPMPAEPDVKVCCSTRPHHPARIPCQGARKHVLSRCLSSRASRSCVVLLAPLSPSPCRPCASDALAVSDRADVCGGFLWPRL